MGLKEVRHESGLIKNPEGKRRVIILTLVVVLTLFVIFITYFLFFPSRISPSERPLLSDKEILKIAGNEPIVKKFISQYPNYNVTILFLNAKNLTFLSQEYPAIYGNISYKELYQVRYASNGTYETLVFITPDKKVVRYYRVHNIVLNL